jgi:hypothetical protein
VATSGFVAKSSERSSSVFKSEFGFGLGSVGSSFVSEGRARGSRVVGDSRLIDRLVGWFRTATDRIERIRLDGTTTDDDGDTG